MDSVTFVTAVLAGLIVGSAIVYFLWNRQRRSKRLTTELLKGYFRGDIDAPAVALQARARMRGLWLHGRRGFCALMTAAFQRAADAHLAHYPHTKEDESKLLRSLAGLKEEFGLPDLYRTEAWRPGRE